MPSTSPKDITEAEFIKYLNDETFVFNNLIITGLLLVWFQALSDSRLHIEAKLINAKFHAGYCIHASQNRTAFKHSEIDTIPNCEQVK